MKAIDGFNMEKDGMTTRTIKAQYGRNSVANSLRQNSYGAAGVIEIYPPRIGFLNTTIEGLCPTLTAHYYKAGTANIKANNGHKDIAVIEIHEQLQTHIDR